MGAKGSREVDEGSVNQQQIQPIPQQYPHDQNNILAAAQQQKNGSSPSPAVGGVPAPSGNSNTRADSGLEPGTVLGRKWLLLDRIGRGAFGDIFIAECILQGDQHFGQRVALKVEKLEIADPETVRLALAAEAAEKAKYEAENKTTNIAAPTAAPYSLNTPVSPKTPMTPQAPLTPIDRNKNNHNNSNTMPCAIPGDSSPSPSPALSHPPPTDRSPSRNSQPSAAGTAATPGATPVYMKRCIVKLEAQILSKLQHCNCVGRFVEYGRDGPQQMAYLAMELLGENLLKLRRQRKKLKFNLPTALRFGMQAIRCIQIMHEAGFIHRDIKPSNFVIGRGLNTHQIYIIDFGLARAYKDKNNNNVLAPRKEIGGFRGTPRYASIYVHREEDLSRRDDLWSLLYILVEFVTGDLPWGTKRDKTTIGRIKERYHSPKLLKGCPSCFLPFFNHLQELTFTSEPNYNYLYSLLEGKVIKLKVSDNDLYDWEDEKSKKAALAAQNTSLQQQNQIIKQQQNKILVETQEKEKQRQQQQTTSQQQNQKQNENNNQKPITTITPSVTKNNKQPNAHPSQKKKKEEEEKEQMTPIATSTITTTIQPHQPQQPQQQQQMIIVLHPHPKTNEESNPQLGSHTSSSSSSVFFSTLPISSIPGAPMVHYDRPASSSESSTDQARSRGGTNSAGSPRDVYHHEEPEDSTMLLSPTESGGRQVSAISLSVSYSQSASYSQHPLSSRYDAAQPPSPQLSYAASPSPRDGPHHPISPHPSSSSSNYYNHPITQSTHIRVSNSGSHSSNNNTQPVIVHHSSQSSSSSSVLDIYHPDMCRLEENQSQHTVVSGEDDKKSPRIHQSQRDTPVLSLASNQRHKKKATTQLPVTTNNNSSNNNSSKVAPSHITYHKINE